MRTFISLLAFFLFGNIAVADAAAAAIRLDGLWRNTRENISVRIESTNQGIRAKRLDQGVWHYYAKHQGDRYVDNNGNYYEIRGNNEIMWKTAGAGKQILFQRVNGNQRDWNQSRPGWQENDRRRDDRRDNGNGYRDRDHHRYDNHDKKHGRHNWHSGLSGAWYSQKGRRSIDIHAEQNGLRVYRGNDNAILFEPTRDRKVFKSRRGDTLKWLNANTIQLRMGDRYNLVFHR